MVTLVDLPYDVINIITKDLSPQDVLNLSLISKAFHQVFTSDSVWRSVVSRYWSGKYYNDVEPKSTGYCQYAIYRFKKDDELEDFLKKKLSCIEEAKDVLDHVDGFFSRAGSKGKFEFVPHLKRLSNDE